MQTDRHTDVFQLRLEQVLGECTNSALQTNQVLLLKPKLLFLFLFVIVLLTFVIVVGLLVCSFALLFCT